MPHNTPFTHGRTTLFPVYVMWVSYSQCIYGWLQTTLYKKELVIDKIGETVRSRGMMYKSVTQLVILYGSDIWVVMGGMLKVLEGFHHRAAMQIKGMMATRGASREWEYPPAAVEMEAVVLHIIREYIRRRQATI